MEIIKQKPCYVVICRCYSGEDSIFAFSKKEDAWKEIEAEAEIEKRNLKETGYDYDVEKSSFGIKLYAHNKDIYYEWTMWHVIGEKDYRGKHLYMLEDEKVGGMPYMVMDEDENILPHPIYLLEAGSEDPFDYLDILEVDEKLDDFFHDTEENIELS